MDPFTIFLIIAAAVTVVGLGIYQIRNGGKPGRRDDRIAAMRDAGVGDSRVHSPTNITGGGFPGPPMG